jgi:hypothetical protein
MIICVTNRFIKEVIVDYQSIRLMPKISFRPCAMDTAPPVDKINELVESNPIRLPKPDHYTIRSPFCPDSFIALIEIVNEARRSAAMFVRSLQFAESIRTLYSNIRQPAMKCLDDRGDDDNDILNWGEACWRPQLPVDSTRRFK